MAAMQRFFLAAFSSSLSVKLVQKETSPQGAPSRDQAEKGRKVPISGNVGRWTSDVLMSSHFVGLINTPTEGPSLMRKSK